MCSKDRHTIGNVAEPERHVRCTIVIVDVVEAAVDVETADVGAEDVGGAGGTKIKEGEGTGKGA